MASSNFDFEDMSQMYNFDEDVFRDDPFMSPPLDRTVCRGRDQTCRSSSPLSPQASPFALYDTEDKAELQKSWQWQQQHQQASPVSSSDASDDLPISPLSVGVEEMNWQRNQQTSVTGDPAHLLVLQQGGEPKQCEVQAKSSPIELVHVSSKSAVPRPKHGDVGPLGVKSSARATSTGSEGGSSKVRQDGTKTVNKRGVKRKKQMEEEEEELVGDKSSDSPIDRNTKNALAARENRLKKKKELEDLKMQMSTFESENLALRKENSEQSKTIGALEEELEYYKNVLFNDSSLAALLQSMNPRPKLKLSSSVGVSSRNRAFGAGGMSGGVCLHVNGPDASLEFCSNCSLKAQESFNK